MHCLSELGQKSVDDLKRKTLRIPIEHLSAIIQARRELQDEHTHTHAHTHTHTRARAHTHTVTHRFPIEVHLNRLTRVGDTDTCQLDAQKVGQTPVHVRAAKGPLTPVACKL
jgi:hypothetical protein